MEKALHHMKAFIAEEEGATAIEYGLLTALIGALIIAGVTAIGTSINAKFSGLATSVGTAS